MVIPNRYSKQQDEELKLDESRCIQRRLTCHSPMIPKDHEGWSTERRQAFLQFAIHHFFWNDNMINQEWWPEENWEDLTKRYPMVFEEPE